MSKTTDHLSKLGITSQEAHDYVSSHLKMAADIYKISDKYDVTTEMLAEIMGGTTTVTDIKTYMGSNGYDTDVLDLTTTEYIAKKGANVQEIHDKIIAKIESPAAVLALSKQYALTTDMLDDVLSEYNANDISIYFKENEMNENELDDHHTTTASTHTEDADHVTLVGTTTTTSTTAVV